MATSNRNIVKTLILILLSFSCLSGWSQSTRTHPINNRLVYKGDTVIFNEQQILLGPTQILVDGTLSPSQAAQSRYQFRSLEEAKQVLIDGTAEQPMVIYFAPYVYWLDDPDAQDIRIAKDGQNTPFAMEIDCQWLKLVGLGESAQDVILAVNRGQTIGAKGNFTMLSISGEGTQASNMTFGNYCNVDLIYPKDPSLGRKKRSDAIVQAQLVFCQGDKILLRDCRFISRLNLCPFIGGKRTLFERCYFELTDDALPGYAVFLDCDFKFFSSKPFYWTRGPGAVFLGGTIRSSVQGTQYLTKAGGQLALINTQIIGPNISHVQWDPYRLTKSAYQHGVLVNGAPYKIGETADLFGKPLRDNSPLLEAFLFRLAGKTYYNTYNLLAGRDQWDPMGIRPVLERYWQQKGGSRDKIPTYLAIQEHPQTLETQKDSLILEAHIGLYSGETTENNDVSFRLAAGSPENAAELHALGGGRCLVVPTWTGDSAVTITVIASDSLGLQTSTNLTINAPELPAPQLWEAPSISRRGDTLFVNYTLSEQRYTDASTITWLRRKGREKAIAVQRTALGALPSQYLLSAQDEGYTLLCEIRPKHVRSVNGAAITVEYPEVLTASTLPTHNAEFRPDLSRLPLVYQPALIPGFWTVDAYCPPEAEPYNWTADNSVPAWYYGTGVDGAARDTGLVQATQGARLRYSPSRGSYGKMHLRLTAVPAKTAAQGFGSARAQYLDIFFKFDHERASGYALRIIRTNKYSNAVDFQLMAFNNGESKIIGNPVSSTAFNGHCDITLDYADNKLSVRATNNRASAPHTDPDVQADVFLSADIIENGYGGFGFQHTGTLGAGACLIKEVKARWK